MLSRFKQKRVLITGGGSGLGKALVEQFSQLGWKIAILDINLEAAQNVAEQANKHGAEAYAIQCDVSDELGFQEIANELQQRWQGIDILVNNAGIASSGLLEETSMAQWQRTININLNGVFRGCHFFHALLPENGPAHIVNIASFAGIALAPSMVSYNVSKAAVIALSESLQIELAHRNIGVTVACPAFFKTNLTDSMLESDMATKQQVSRWMNASKISAGQVAEDILRAVEKNLFMQISHGYAKKVYWLKRFMPNFYKKKLMQKVAGIKASRSKNTR